jgi:hypothetical protein
MSQARPLPRLCLEPIYTGIIMQTTANNPAANSSAAMRPRKSRRKRLMLAFLAIFLLPVLLGAGALAYRGGPTHWSDWDRTVTSQLPPAAEHPQARILVMSGRTRGWKGVVAVHSWVVVKGENERTWRRYDVAGWGDPVRMNWWPPDLWFGERGRVIADITGARAQALIPRVDAAIKSYKYSHNGDYRIWPGPNSNTFVATVLRAIPEVDVTLPTNAIGRDFRPWPYLGWTDSGTGVEANLWGLLGVKLGWVEGLEVNVLGLVAGLDLRNPALKVPGFGHLGWPQETATAAPRLAK